MRIEVPRHIREHPANHFGSVPTDSLNELKRWAERRENALYKGETLNKRHCEPSLYVDETLTTHAPST